MLDTWPIYDLSIHLRVLILRGAEARIHETEPSVVRLRRRDRLRTGGCRSDMRVGVETHAAIQGRIVSRYFFCICYILTEN